MRRFLAVFALAGLVLALAAPSALAKGPAGWSATSLNPASTFNASKSLTGRLAQSDPDLISRTDSRMVNVMIKFDLDPIASYQGDLKGLKATSPSVTGKSLKQNAKAVAAYQKYLTSQAKATRTLIKSSVRSIRFLGTYLTAYGGVAAQIPARQAKQLLSVPGVSAVQYDALEQPLVDYDYSPGFIGAEAVWPSLGGSVFAGEGVKVGVIDTGIWPEHPMLEDPGLPAPPGGPYACDFGTSGEPGDDSFTCNNKLLGAYDETATYRAVHGAQPGEYCAADQSSCSARDADGHGTHTSTTAVGDAVDSAVLLGVERGPVSGIAPGASVIMYRVCLSAGCYGSDSVAAVEQAILDGVDVINFSISGGANAYTDPVEIAFFDAYAAGIEVNASAGNSGPGAATADHAGPWTTTVGASTWDKAFSSTLHLTADGGDTLDIPGVTLTQGITSPTPVVLASDYPDPNAGDCYINKDDAHPDGLPFPPGTFTGEIVVCHRATIARIAKGYNVLQGDAAGMVLYNTGSTTDLESDNHFLPAIQVNDQSESIADFVNSHTNVMATWDEGTLEPAQADVMASFSSRGPSGDFIKPDVTAPGVQILAGNAYMHLFAPNDGLGPQGELYQAIAGTSMSSPHAAGTAALIKAAHPGWTPGMIKSAMMTSSVQDVVKEDGSTPADPFDDGAGSIRANRAVSPTVTFDVNPISYVLSASDPMGRINLNLPSINAPSMSGVITTWRTAQNVTGTRQRLYITADAPAGTSITVSPSSIVLGPFQAKPFSVTIDASGAPDGQYFGQITLNPQKTGYLNAVLPVAFNKVPGNVPLTNNCDSTSMDVGDSVNCQVSLTNLTATAANVALQVSAAPDNTLKIKDFSDGLKLGNGFTWSGQLSPALAPEIIALDTPDGGPGGGYLPLALFFAPQSGYGDETIANYDVPPFLYGNEVYSRIAVDSNGYVVIGGGNSTDNNCCSPAMPDSARPNNVLAPYWTDLDVSAGGGVYVGILTDGVTDWLAVDWENVPLWGTSDYRSFQVWIQLGATEGAWFEYDDGSWFGTPPGPGAGSGLIVGAENRDGSSAATLGLDTVPSSDGYFVETGSPIPGGSITISYDVLGHKVGSGKVKALSASDVTPGISKKVVTLDVN